MSFIDGPGVPEGLRLRNDFIFRIKQITFLVIRGKSNYTYRLTEESNY
jgi:hypothetical protein